jgi:hypothetical protein
MARAFADTGSGFVTVEARSPDVAEAARDLLQKAIDRNARDQQLVKALADAAVRWQKQADSITRPSDPLKTFYRDKARKAIHEAARIIAAGER